MEQQVESELHAIFKNKLGIEIQKADYDHPLLGSEFDLSPRDLVYLLFDIEKKFEITIPQANIINGCMLSFSGIYATVLTCLAKKELAG